MKEIILTKLKNMLENRLSQDADIFIAVQTEGKEITAELLQALISEIQSGEIEIK